MGSPKALLLALPPTARPAEIQSAEIQSAEIQGAEIQGAEIQSAEIQSADLQSAALGTGGPTGFRVAKSETWLDRSVEVLRSAGASAVWVAGGEEEWVRPPARHVPDQRPGEGPLAGIEAAMQRGLAEGGPAWWLILACDHPLLRTSALTKLLDRRGAGAAPNPRLVVARGRNGVQPLLACYHVSLLSSLRAYLDGGQRSARGFVRAFEDRVELELPEPDLFNANTPGDLREIP